MTTFGRKGGRKKRGARLGQHFLTGVWAALRLAQSVDVRSDETILEIGPGKGALTKELLATRARVIAIEKDPMLVQKLNEGFRKSIIAKQLILIEADIRDVDPMRLNLNPGKYVVAANIPYYITGEIIRQFLTADIQPRAMALLVQKEVADRIIARDHKESILSLSVKVYGMPKIVAKVSRGNFSPPPSVDSAILLIEEISRERLGGMRDENFFSIVRAGFASKRKYLLNNLAAVFDKEKVREAFAQLNISEKARAEDVGLDTWRTLTVLISK